MIEKVYWILAISTMIVLLFSSIYSLVIKIQDDIDFKKFKKKQKELLEQQIKNI